MSKDCIHSRITYAMASSSIERNQGSFTLLHIQDCESCKKVYKKALQEVQETESVIPYPKMNDDEKLIFEKSLNDAFSQIEMDNSPLSDIKLYLSPFFTFRMILTVGILSLIASVLSIYL